MYKVTDQDGTYFSQIVCLVFYRGDFICVIFLELQYYDFEHIPRYLKDLLT